ncbi:alpha/beta-hydrolase, partial [Thozetella sp. PMI_491]
AVGTRGVSRALFASLERMSRLVDITYCVGTSGVSRPFSCASRCSEFPTVELVKTWNTGILLSDSCGFVAVDRGLEKSIDGEVAHPPEIVVAFRGTYSITNTIIDLSTVPQEYVPYPAPGDGDGEEGGAPKQSCTNCTVHMGFFASWRSARELVLPALKEAMAKHPGYPVHLVGHSLGGAVAALAALELKLALGLEDVKVTTFGEPRIGNSELALYLNAAFNMTEDDGYNPDLESRVYQRVTHMDDPVPLLPLTEWGYRPHAGEVYIAKSDLQPAPENLRICRGNADPTCIAGADSADYTGFLASLIRGEEDEREVTAWSTKLGGIPSRFKLWQLFFAHRDYFWRLGLCVPGGDPTNWGRHRYEFS